MRILFLDDEQNRFDKLQPRCIGAILDWAKTAAEAITSLKQHSYNLVMLDHDLSIEDILSETPKYPTGMEVVNYIIDHKDQFSNTTFIVHSLNTYRAAEMNNRLQEVGLTSSVIPFAWMQLKVVIPE